MNNITVDELKKGNAAFFCGTGAEVIGFESLDDYKFPLKWSDSVSRKVQTAYMKLVREDFSEPRRHEDTKAHKEVAA